MLLHESHCNEVQLCELVLSVLVMGGYCGFAVENPEVELQRYTGGDSKPQMRLYYLK